MGVLDLLSGGRRTPGNMPVRALLNQQQAPGSSAPSGIFATVPGATPSDAVLLGSSPVYHSIKRPLATKQGTTSLTLAPIHSFPCENTNEVETRFDVNVNYATSITANQPGALAFDRVKAYVRPKLVDDQHPLDQLAEVEGRALPAASYFVAHLYSLLGLGAWAPGSDSALVNNTTKYGYYRPIGMLTTQDLLIENVMKAAPIYLGTGAETSYAENDGAGGIAIPGAPGLARYFLGRSLTVNQIGIARCRAFLIAGASDFNSGFTIRTGRRSYVTEEINDIEDKLLDYFGVAGQSITGAASAAPATHGVRGLPQDPFTGAGVYMFCDVFDEDTDISVVVSGAAAAIQVVALTNGGLGAIRSA